MIRYAPTSIHFHPPTSTPSPKFAPQSTQPTHLPLVDVIPPSLQICTRVAAVDINADPLPPPSHFLFRPSSCVTHASCWNRKKRFEEDVISCNDGLVADAEGQVLTWAYFFHQQPSSLSGTIHSLYSSRPHYFLLTSTFTNGFLSSTGPTPRDAIMTSSSTPDVAAQVPAPSATSYSCPISVQSPPHESVPSREQAIPCRLALRRSSLSDFVSSRSPCR